MADFSQNKKYNYNWQSSKFKNLALSGSYISQFINDAGYVTSSVAISASYALTASYLSGTIASASYALTASYFGGTVTSASYALTASYVTGITAYERLSDYQFPYHYSGNATLGTSTSSTTWIVNRIDFTTPGSPITLQGTGSWDNRTSLIYS